MPFILGLPGCWLWTGRWSLCRFVVLPVGFMCSGSAVISGEMSAWWGSAMWCIMVVEVCAGAPVMQVATVWRLVKWSRMASVRITTTVTPISGVMWVRMRSTESVPVSMVTVGMPGVAMILRCWSVTSTRVAVSASCWCAWRCYFVRAICCNVSIIVTIEATHMRTIACHVASFLALETLVIVTRHGVDQWWWQWSGCYLLGSMKFFNFLYGIC